MPIFQDALMNWGLKLTPLHQIWKTKVCIRPTRMVAEETRKYDDGKPKYLFISILHNIYIYLTCFRTHISCIPATSNRAIPTTGCPCLKIWSSRHVPPASSFLNRGSRNCPWRNKLYLKILPNQTSLFTNRRVQGRLSTMLMMNGHLKVQLAWFR